MISIITSAYNAQSTISRTIESVQSQSFKDWEMIVVDDCSTDSTAEIVKSYAEKDDRIRLVSHNVNKGAGLARRTGIENIKGEWMTFLDSDDYLKADCLETLSFYASNYDVDIVSQGYITITQSGEILKENVSSRKVILTDGAKFKPNKQDTKRFMNPMLIKSSLWDKVTYSARRFIEDTPTLVQILYWARNIMLIDYAGYYYVQNPTSLIHSASRTKTLIYMALSAKDINLFFKRVKHQLANNTEHIKALISEVNKVITESEKVLYKQELEELRQWNYN